MCIRDSVRTAASGIPFFIGAWPCHQGKGFVGKPQLVATYNEAVELGGYSDEWRAVDGAPKLSLIHIWLTVGKQTNR